MPHLRVGFAFEANFINARDNFIRAEKCFNLFIEMKLAATSHQRLEAFFREYMNDADFRLPVIYFHVGKFAKILTNLISVHGITFGRRIFITPTLLSLNQNNFPKLPEDLIAHEITHTLQYRKEGFAGFLYKYLTDYWRNLRKTGKWNASARREAYLNIPFEIEARKVAAQFVEWSRGK